MPLKNVSKETLELRWGGITVEVKPDDVVDMMGFNITRNEIPILEHRFGSKFKDKLVIVDTAKDQPAKEEPAPKQSPKEEKTQPQRGGRKKR